MSGKTEAIEKNFDRLIFPKEAKMNWDLMFKKSK